MNREQMETQSEGMEVDLVVTPTNAFTDKINSQINQLSCTEYINYVWKQLSEEPSIEVCNLSKEQERKYQEHLPLEVEEYLIDLTSTLRKTNNASLTKDQQKYIITLIQYYVKSLGAASEAYILYVADLFFLVANSQPKDIFKSSSVYRKVLQNVIQILSDRLIYSCVIPFEVLRDFNFLMANKHILPADHQDIIIFLCQVAVYNNTAIYKTFGNDVPTESEETATYFAFNTLWCILKQQCKHEDDIKEALTVIIHMLMFSFDKNIAQKQDFTVLLHVNVKNFIKEIIASYTTRKWMIKLFICYAERYNDSSYFMDLLNFLSIEFYELVTFNLCKELLQEDDVLCKEKLDNVIYMLVHNPHPHLSLNKRKLFCRTYIKDIMLLLKDENAEIYERALKSFIRIANATNPLLEFGLGRLLINANGRPCDLCTETLTALSKRIDRHWRKKALNVSFLNLMWQLYLKYPNAFKRTNRNVLEELTTSASSTDLRECVPILKTVIISMVDLDYTLSTFLFRILINHMLIPTVLSNFYAQQVNELTFRKLVGQTAASDTAFKLIYYITSQEIDYPLVLKKMVSLNYIDSTMVDFVLRYCVFQLPDAWCVAQIILQVVPYVGDLPVRLKEFFSHPSENILKHSEFNNALNCMLHILNGKPALVNDLFITTTFQQFLHNGFASKKFDFSNIKTVILLIKIVYKMDVCDIPWIKEIYKVWIRQLLEAFQSQNTLDIIYHHDTILYVSELYFVGQLDLHKQLFTALEKEVRVDSLPKYMEFPDMWALLLIFFTRISIQHEVLMDGCLQTINFSLENAPDSVKIHALSALNDLCISHRADNHLYTSVLYSMLGSNQDELLKFTAYSRLVKFYSEQNVVLEYREMFQLIRPLMEFDSEVKVIHFVHEFHTKLMTKLEQPTAKYFVQFILHFNQYTTLVPMFSETLPSEVTLYPYPPDKRLFIYKFLFEGLTTYIRFNLVDQIALHIINPIVTGKLVGSGVNDVLHDCIVVITILALKTYTDDIKCKEVFKFFEAVIQDVKKDFAKKAVTEKDPNVPSEYNPIIKNVLICLLKLMYKVEKISRTLIQDVFFALIMTIKAFYGNLGPIINENSLVIKPLLSNLEFFYNEHRHELHYGYDGVNLEVWRSVF